MKFKTYVNEGVVSTVVAYDFVKKLSTNFEDWKEFKDGIIDADGKIIKSSKKKMPPFQNIARKIKLLFHKFVPNKKYLALLLAMYLLKEDIDEMENIVKEQLEKDLTPKEKKLLIKVLMEVTSTDKGVGEYSEKLFVGKGLTDDEARTKGLKMIKRDHRGFSYNTKSGYCKFI